MTRSVGITGATGYLGTALERAFAGDGWSTVRLVRTPSRPTDRRFVLGSVIDPARLASLDVLIHAAYDMRIHREEDIWSVNVGGTKALLRAARDAGIGRVLVLSSMSAYPGTKQNYGRAKLAIEDLTAAFGGISVRPGLVVGPNAGGMAGSLARLAALPLTPSIVGAGMQFPVHESDFVSAMLLLASTPDPPNEVLGIACGKSVAFEDLLRAIATMSGTHRPRFVRLPWQPIYGLLRAAEILQLPSPFRSDSLMGLIHPAPSVPGLEALRSIGFIAEPVTG